MSMIIKFWNRRAVASIGRGVFVVRHDATLCMRYRLFPSVLEVASIILMPFGSYKAGRNERPPRVGVNLMYFCTGRPCTILLIEKLNPPATSPESVSRRCMM